MNCRKRQRNKLGGRRTTLARQLQAIEAQMVPQEVETEKIEEQKVVEPATEQPTKQNIHVVESLEEKDKDTVVASKEKE